MYGNWLEEFVAYGSFGEVSPRLLYWAGVSAVAGALRRKVWFDQEDYQWTPNFYIIIVGAPGVVRKTTSIDISMRLLNKVEGVQFGPEIVTWQALIENIAANKQEVVMKDGEIFPMSCVQLALSEFGTFFDPEERNLVDNLTNLWDGKLGTTTKLTKLDQNDMVNPFINIIAATTPEWMADNFPAAMVGGGFASRCIFLHEQGCEKVIAYPKRSMPKGRATMRFNLIDGLREIADYQGDYELTEAAYRWGEEWYAKLRRDLAELGLHSLEAGFMVRKQVHLHKLAMVIAAAKYRFPVIDVEDLEEADARLLELEADMGRIFGFVGQSKVTKAAREIVEIVTRQGNIDRRELYRKFFFRTMTATEFRDAVNSVILTRTIEEVPGRGLRLRQVPLVRLVK